jgi:DUF4097 and DUF4098 domain-containing protein YvlB
MRNIAVAILVTGATLVIAAPAVAQTLPFERTFDVDGPARLDVSTIRGKIDVSAGDETRIVVSGGVTVRMGWDVPANAAALARAVADHPPIERDGSTIRLRPPSGADERRAVTVSYRVRVPRGTSVVSVSDSGATAIRDVTGSVDVRTQSGAIEVKQAGGATTISSGSGAVGVEEAAGPLSVTTSSSAITARGVKHDLRVRTGSGAVNAALSGPGGIDVETESSSVRLTGARGALSVTTGSGRVIVDGAPGGAWKTSTGSGSVEMSLEPAPLTIDAKSGSGSVTLQGGNVVGTVSKKRIDGTVDGGGPRVTIESRSGSIRLALARR